MIYLFMKRMIMMNKKDFWIGFTIASILALILRMIDLYFRLK
jgi:hypothetical protein